LVIQFDYMITPERMGLEPTINLSDKLEKLSENPLFWFLKKDVVKDSPFWSLLTHRLHEAQDSVNSHYVFYSNQHDDGSEEEHERQSIIKKLGLLIETRGGKEGKLNEDAILIENLGDGRAVFAVFDGASSQAPIKALEEHGVSGAFYVSHLAAFGFSTSEEYKELCDKEDVSPREFILTLNSWLYDQMNKIDGVNYDDVLTIPGMAATIVIVDFNKQSYSIGSVADTVGIDHSTSGGWEIITDNLNERFDEETMNLVKEIARRKGISIREAAGYPEVKDQLAASFRKKINTPDGCGILNGMPDLEHSGLIEEHFFNSLSGLHQLVLCSDGALTPFSSDSEISEFLLKIKKFKEKHWGDDSMMGEVKDLLDSDPDFALFERLKHADDATLLVIEFSSLLGIAFERLALGGSFYRGE